MAIDDDPLVLHTLAMVLEEDFGTILTAEHPTAALPYFEQHDIGLVILDLNFATGDADGGEGLAWLKQLLSRYPELVIIILTAHGFIDIAVKAVKLGATDFLEKPFVNEKLIASVQSALNLARSKRSLAEVNAKTSVLINQAKAFEHLVIGSSGTMQAVMQMVNKVAETDAAVLITGEHGTGKEMLAKYIHSQSKRSMEPFIHADLHSITGSLFESTLFGHVKGAFTDAQDDRTGLIEAANLGTLLLDELASLPLALQAKLLTVLQNRVVNRIGDNRNKAVDFRLISTSHLSLEELTDAKQLRQDLLYRINTVHIHLPALRDRKDDIVLLAQHFLTMFNQKYGHDLGFSKTDLKLLEQQPWPGNVRELKNSIERMVVMQEVDFSPLSVKGQKTDRLIEVEKQKIAEVMARHSGNITHAAAELGIGRNTLYRKLKKYAL